MTRGVISLWTHTPMFHLRRGPLLIQTLSMCLAAEVFSEVQFVTDDYGYLVAKTLGWEMGDVSLVLEALKPDGLSHVWALGKILACAIQKRPFVQFDGDVLLFRTLPARLTEARLCAQSRDFDAHYRGRDMESAYVITELPRNTPKYNAGLIGGADIHMVRAWALYAQELAKRFRHKKINGTTTSMVIEQASLGVFALSCLVEVETLFNSQLPTHEECAAAGYAHLIGAAKHDPYWVGKAERRLRDQYPAAYEKFLDGIRYLPLCTEPPPPGSYSA